MQYFHIEKQVYSCYLTVEQEFFSLDEAAAEARKIFKKRKHYTGIVRVYLWNTDTEQRDEALIISHVAGKNLERWGDIPTDYVIPENHRTNKPLTL